MNSRGHGYSAYSGGCRCDVCRSAKADYMRERRAAARSVAQVHTTTANGARPNRWTAYANGSTRYVAGVGRHGTRYAYEERGCRCRACTSARSGSDRKYRQSPRSRGLKHDRLHAVDRRPSA